MSGSRISGGVVVPVVTPFDEDEDLDVGAFRAIVEYLISGGVAGLLVTGTNGEAYALEFDERRRLYEAAVAQSAGRVPIIAGTGATTTREAARLTALAADCGCDAAAAITPWFQPRTTGSLARYYTELADSARLPLLFYHNPLRTHVDWPVEAIASLAHELAGRVIGVKDSAHDVQRVAALRPIAPPGFLIFSGWPHRGAEFAAAGADGCIDALSNALPNEAVAAFGGDAEKAALYGEANGVLASAPNLLVLLKRLMVALGLPAGRPRRPADEVDETQLAGLRSAVSGGGRMAAGAADGSGEPMASPGDGLQPVHLLAPGAVQQCVAADPVRAKRVVLWAPAAGDDQYNHHEAVIHHGGRYFAAFSSGPINEDSPGQMIRVSVSPDAEEWSPPQVVTPAEGKARWTCGGFWRRGDELWLLATRYSSARYVDGRRTAGVCWEELATEGLLWEGGQWRRRGVLLEDFYSNEAPRALPDGRWLWPGADSRHDAVLAVGEAGTLDEWDPVIVAPRTKGWRLTEPSWYVAEGGVIRALFRDDGGSRRLFLSESSDGGSSWSAPMPTDFSDAQAKFCALNLPDGRVAVVCNPAPDEVRRKLLAVAVSRDGGLFDRLIKLGYDPEMRPRLPGMHKEPGFGYPNAVVADGRLWVIYSPNKEDVHLAGVDLGDL